MTLPSLSGSVTNQSRNAVWYDGMVLDFFVMETISHAITGVKPSSPHLCGLSIAGFSFPVPIVWAVRGAHLAGRTSLLQVTRQSVQIFA